MGLPRVGFRSEPLYLLVTEPCWAADIISGSRTMIPQRMRRQMRFGMREGRCVTTIRYWSPLSRRAGIAVDSFGSLG